VPIEFVQEIGPVQGVRDAGPPLYTRVTFTIPAGGVPVGHRLILLFGQWGFNLIAIESVSDTKGNVWISHGFASQNIGTPNLDGGCWSSHITTALEPGDTVTLVSITAQDNYSFGTLLEYSGIRSTSAADDSAGLAHEGVVPPATVDSGYSIPTGPFPVVYVGFVIELTELIDLFTQTETGWTALATDSFTDTPGFDPITLWWKSYYNISTDIQRRLRGDLSNAEPAVSITLFVQAFRPAALGVGADLIRLPSGMLVRTYVGETGIHAEYSRDAGVTWNTQVIADDADEECAPRLVSDRWGNVWVWYHQSTPAARVWMSVDEGVTWTDFATLGSLRYPAPARLDERLFIAAFDGTSLRIYGSDNDGTTVSWIGAIASLSPHSISLEATRQGTLVLRYVDGAGAVREVYSDDGITWSSPALVATAADAPSAGYGMERGLTAWFEGNEMFLKTTTETGMGTDTTVPLPSLGLEPQHLGIAYTPEEGAYLMALDTDGAPQVVWTRSPGAGSVWSNPS
jgi:hypothetical protein